LRTWLLGIIVNEARSSWRRYRRAPVDPRLPVFAGGYTVDSGLDVRRAVNRLPPSQLAAIVLHYYLDLAITDAATVLGKSPSTVKSALADARVRLAEELGASYDLD
jgi:RNA polymerase sigma-70 factor (ECF subfamily)